MRRRTRYHPAVRDTAAFIGTHPETLVTLAGLGVIGYALYWFSKQANIQTAASGAAQAVVDAASGAAAGTVIGIGEQLGIPATNEDLCAQAQASGDLWAASKYCTASEFLFGKKLPGNTGGATGTW